jgi:hypothetical protein
MINLLDGADVTPKLSLRLALPAVVAKLIYVYIYKIFQRSKSGFNTRQWPLIAGFMCEIRRSVGKIAILPSLVYYYHDQSKEVSPVNRP